VIDRYLTLVRNRPTLQRVSVVIALEKYLGRDSRCRELLQDLDWLAVAQQALDDPDRVKDAIWPATQLGLRFQDQLQAHLQRTPFDSYLWHFVDLDMAASLAERLLPLAELMTGPALDNGLGRPYAAEHCLDTVVGRLADRPGLGWPLIRAALSNRTIRNRNMAVFALRKWPRDSLPADAPQLLRAAIEAEPATETRDAMNELLGSWRGHSLSIQSPG
jgi:hypothetical protein